MTNTKLYTISVAVVFALLVILAAKPFLIYCMGFLAGIGFTQVANLCHLRSRLTSQYRALQGHVLKQVKRFKK